MSNRILATVAIVSTVFAISGCQQGSAPAAAPGAPVPASTPVVTSAPAPAIAPAPAAPIALQAPSAPAPVAAPVAPQTQQLSIQGYSAPVPASWHATAPSSSMRVAQFEVPAAAGVEAGELAAYFFPAGQGGSHEANIERWASQFAGPGGKAVAPKVDISKLAEGELTLVELRGSYARGVGMGPAGEAKPNQTLLVAMVETAAGRITLHFYGPDKTVAAQRAAFIALARGFKRA
ncbi:MAG: hypothetical protein V4508_06565 [Pseudomonadota bacterium]